MPSYQQLIICNHLISTEKLLFFKKQQLLTLIFSWMKKQFIVQKTAILILNYVNYSLGLKNFIPDF